MAVDPTSFLHDEVKRAKRRLERALEKGEIGAAHRQALRVAELLRELARHKRVGGRELLRLAKEYEELAARLQGEGGVAAPASSAQRPAVALEHTVPHGVQPVARARGVTGDAVNELDMEFEAHAEALKARASVTWDDIADLEEAKKALIEAIYFSLAKPEEPVRLTPPRRFLLYGPPGTGKTMLAMAASNMLGATFFNVSVDRVLSRYVGDSPRMISAIFRVAARRAPSIIFFDEIEVLAARRDSGREAATGVVQTFLTELDGFKTKKLEKPVIVIAATNKPWMLDEAILSRFEKRIYIPLPDREARKQIFKLELERKGFRIEGITYDELADMTEGYSGRDIANMCREAVMLMLREANPDIYSRVNQFTSLRELLRARYRVKPLTREHFMKALEKVKPAVTGEELRRYEEWTRQKGSTA